MEQTHKSIKWLVLALSSELFDIGANHERAPELRERILSLLRLARARGRARAANRTGSGPDATSL